MAAVARPHFAISLVDSAAKHLLRPSDALCEAYMLTVPNISVRMSEITAAVLRPLLKSLPERVIEYNRRYQLVRVPTIRVSRGVS